MEFLFIDNSTSTDRRAQRLIRSHGMKGKNAGKVIAARGHRGQWQREETKSTSSGSSEETASSTSSDNSAVSISRGRLLLPKKPLLQANPFSGSEFTYFATPVPVTAYTRQLFYDLHNAVSDELYPRTFCRPSAFSSPTKGDDIATRWFETVMTNPTVYHCGLAVMGIHRYQLLGRRDEPQESTRHLVRAMSLLRRELDGDVDAPNVIIVSVVTVVVSLAIRANFLDTPAESRMHLLALQKIIERKGGLAALCAASPELGNKIRRTDVELALRAGTPTIFGGTGNDQCLSFPSGLELRQHPPRLPSPLGNVDPMLKPMILDTFILVGYAGMPGSNDDHRRLDPVEYQAMVISIVQRLNDYAPLDLDRLDIENVGRTHSVLSNICQLAFLSFMTTILFREPQRRAAYCQRVSRLLHSALFMFHDFGSMCHYAGLSLWIVIVSGMSLHRRDPQARHPDPKKDRYNDPEWITSARLRELAMTLEIATWDEALPYLRRMPWVDAFHNDAGKKIWERANIKRLEY